MGKNILISKSAKEVKKELKAAIDTLKALKELVVDKKTDDEEKAEWIEVIKDLEEQIIEVDDERWFLVDKADESKIIIDFWKKYSSNEVAEEFQNGHQFISVMYEDSECNTVHKLIDLNGIEIVESCIDYYFIGKNEEYLVIEQLGYMLNKHWDKANETFFSILGSNSIQGVKYIDYLSEFNVISVNQNYLYDGKDKYLGKLVLQGDYYIIYENDDELQGFIYGEFISEAKYSYLKYLQYGLFQYKTDDLLGYIKVDETGMVYDKNMVSEKVKLISTRYDDTCLVFYKDNKSFLSIYNSEINEWSDFSFDNVSEISPKFLSKTILIGSDIKDNKTTIFVFNDDSFASKPEEVDSENKLFITYTIEGTDWNSIYEYLFT